MASLEQKHDALLVGGFDLVEIRVDVVQDLVGAARLPSAIPILPLLP